MGNGIVEQIIEALMLALQSVGVVPGAGPTPMSPEYYALLFIVLAMLLFEHRKMLMMLYFTLGYLMFGHTGLIVAMIFWVVMYPVNMAFDFFAPGWDW